MYRLLFCGWLQFSRYRIQVNSHTNAVAEFARTDIRSSECYCGNAIATPGGPAPNGEGCNMVCNGAPGEACGGPDRLSLYERAATPPAQSSATGIEDGADHIWTSRGCYSDLTYARILAQSVGVQGGAQNNSAQSCTTECRRQNFRYAGTEYGQECSFSPLFFFSDADQANRLLWRYTQQQP